MTVLTRKAARGRNFQPGDGKRYATEKGKESYISRKKKDWEKGMLLERNTLGTKKVGRRRKLGTKPAVRGNGNGVA